jgi:hypothetical protein
MSSTQSSALREFLYSNILYKNKNKKYFHKEFDNLDRGIFHYANELLKQYKKFFSNNKEDCIKQRSQLFGEIPISEVLQDISIHKYDINLDFLFLILRKATKHAFINSKCNTSFSSIGKDEKQKEEISPLSHDLSFPLY